MLQAVLASFGVALLSPWLVRVFKGRSGWLLALLPLALTVYFGRLAPGVSEGSSVTQSFPWLPALGVELSFYLDGLSLLFALLISFIGVFIVVYAGGYLRDDPNLGRFYLALLAFMAAMLGLVLSDNLITLFVFWELTSLTSFFLVGYKHQYEESRKSALQALLVTGLGGLAMLAGFLLLGSVAGTYTISELLTQSGAIQGHALYLPTLLLVLLGAFTKSAQFPFHFWLPNAMAAPTPVSAYLHSATMVKAGIYLLARLSPTLGGTAAWLWLLGAAGLLTVLTAGVLALKQRDLKKLLAYSTLVALGLLTMLLAVGTPAAVKAAMVFLLAHSLYKASLFMVAGTVDHQAGTRDVTELSGLARVMPLTFVAALFAAFSTAGLPPKLGFIGKELAYEGLLGAPALLVAAVLSNATMFVVAALVALKPFVGRSLRAPQAVRGAPLSLWLGPFVLAGLGLVFGLFPELIELTKLPAVAAVLAAPYEFSLYLFPSSFTPALILSIVTVALGLVLLALWSPIYRGLSRLKGFDWGPARGYDLSLKGLIWLAETQTRLVQGDNLRRHLAVILGFTVALVGATAVFRGGLNIELRLETGYFYEYVLAGLVVAAALAATLARTRLAAVTALGVVGFGVALLFVVFAAPDLAITQFLVETLLVIIVVLVTLRLPEWRREEGSSRPTRLRDGFIALAGGGLVTVLLLSVTSPPFSGELTAFFESESWPSAFGRNIVNVILVDFRALDTLGEITVLAVAALGVFALLRTRVNPRAEVSSNTSTDTSPGTSPGSSANFPESNTNMSNANTPDVTMPDVTTPNVTMPKTDTPSPNTPHPNAPVTAKPDTANIANPEQKGTP